MSLEEVLKAKKEGESRLPWGTCNLDDFRNYYQMFHEGKSRGEVKESDPNFYDALRGRKTLPPRKLVDKVLPESKRKDWGSMNLKEFKAYYKKNHEGKSRGEVAESDIRFYNALLRRKLIDKVILITTGLDGILEALEEDKKEFPWGTCNLDDFKNYYQMFHEGKSRGEVEESDPNFYSALWNRELVDKVLPESKYKDWSYFKNIEDWIEEYNKHPEWKGRSPQEMQKDKESGASSFYSSFIFWMCKQTKNKEERERLRSIIFQYKLRINYASSNIPKCFERKHTGNRKRSQKHKGKLDEKIQEKFDKGVLFEQFAGLILKYLYPGELVLGQYCLNVNARKKIFINRIDWKVKDEVYEIKIGSPFSSQNIRETIEKQVPYCDGRFKHHLVTLDNYMLEEDLKDKTEQISIWDLIKGNEEFVKLAEKISSNKILIEDYKPMINFTYTSIVKANNIRKNSTQAENIALNAVRKLNDGSYKNEKNLFYCNPLRAIFEYKEKLYQDYIDISNFLKEEPQEKEIETKEAARPQTKERFKKFDLDKIAEIWQILPSEQQMIFLEYIGKQTKKSDYVQGKV